MSTATDLARKSGGCVLRRTRRHDGSRPRYYVCVEHLGRAACIRVSREDYTALDNAAQVKCAFITNIKRATVQQQHSIML